MRVLAGILALAMSTITRPAPAQTDARRATEELLRAWRATGASTVELSPRFLFEDGRAVVTLPKGEVGPCTYVAIVGPRGASFRAQFSDVSRDPLASETGGRASSVAGVVELRRCDAGRAPTHVIIASEAGRGTVEIVVAHGAQDLPDVNHVLPERTGGTLPPPPKVGALPPQASPEKRADVADARARREGAKEVHRGLLMAGEDGTGEDEIDLPAGCHRLEIFGKDPRTTRPAVAFHLDIDAELLSTVDDRLLARDRTESPNASLEVCLAEPERVSIVYVGATPKAGLILTLSTWPLPEHLPTLWGSEATARMALALSRRYIRTLSGDPVYLAQTSSGRTKLPVPVEPGACYLAIAATTRGQAQALKLQARTGMRSSSNERGAEDGSAAVTFCAREARHAELDLLARGSGVGVGLALYRLTSGVWEDPR